MTVSKEKKARAQWIAFATLGVFALLVAVIASWSTSLGDQVLTLQIIAAAVSLPMIYNGALRVVEPGIPFRYTNRSSEHARVNGQRMLVTKDGQSGTGLMSRKSAWFVAVAPASLFYGTALMYTLCRAGVIPIGAVAAFVLAGALVLGGVPLLWEARDSKRR